MLEFLCFFVSSHPVNDNNMCDIISVVLFTIYFLVESLFFRVRYNAAFVLFHKNGNGKMGPFGTLAVSPPNGFNQVL